MTLKNRDEADEIGQQIYQLIADLYPICRSITGNGLRATLNLLRRHLPLEIHEVPTGTAVSDWTIPEGVEHPRMLMCAILLGQKVIDFRKSNLHVVSYSVPVQVPRCPWRS